MRLAKLLWALAFIAGLGIGRPVRAEDGYDLWLRYPPVEERWREVYQAADTVLVGGAHNPTLDAADAELLRGLGDLLGRKPAHAAEVTQDGALVFGTPASSPIVARLSLPLAGAGAEGYLIRSVMVMGHKATVVAANTDIGVLYGVFRYLSLLQTRQPVDRLDIASTPKIKLRVLDHWDNLNGTVERGYAGASIWDWWTLPAERKPRYTDYARANASIGLNGAVLNNVNADVDSLTAPYIAKAAALADVFRPYGVRVYLSVRFSAPVELGRLPTADPLDPRVQAWWRDKADEIYRAIPDFGGFLVKANSEGQPGPQDYHRTHAQGADMLADALAPHGGVVMWRAFVYSKDQPDDRAKQAFTEFTPLDGQFRSNVVLQVKNGAIDFQPREPFHPLFGAMPKTPLMMEFQITKEYLGFATHLVYLGPLFEDTLRADTYAKGEGSTVAKVVDGALDHHALTGMAGVANIGTDRNWSGSIFNQANWYAFGRLAWDPDQSSRAIAQDWARMTFTNNPAFVTPVVDMMMRSREAAVDYMTPLGLHHQMARDTHYGPGPWVTGGPRADWTATYYNRADSSGIGFDRTASGSNAVAQYRPQAAAQFSSLNPAEEKYLLWFHHLPWTYRTASGRSLWDEMVADYTRGVQTVDEMRSTWARMKPYVDAERFDQTATFLDIQAREARWWRDASIAYFQSLSHLPLPPDYAPPEHSLAYYESLRFPNAPGR